MPARELSELSVGRFSRQFKLEMRFRSIRLQHLPLFDQMIVIFEKQLERVDVFGALRPVSDVFEREHHRIGIFSKSFGA